MNSLMKDKIDKRYQPWEKVQLWEKVCDQVSGMVLAQVWHQVMDRVLIETMVIIDYVCKDGLKEKFKNE